MKMHWSRFGYMAACGRRLSGTRWLTRVAGDVTCQTCRKVMPR